MSPEYLREATRLFSSLEYGEQLAHECALRQSAIIGCNKSRKFLKVQALQEFMHAKFYNKAIDHIGSNKKNHIPDALTVYAKRLQQAMKKEDTTDYLVGSQVVLEGFGEQIIQRLNVELDNHGIGFKRIRKLIIRQEQSHQAFGLQMLKSQIENGETKIEYVEELVSEYLHHIQSIIVEMDDVFGSFDANAEDIIMILLQIYLIG